MVPSASTNIMLEPPAPRSVQVLSSKAERSGMKFVSHMLRPGRTGTNSPSPLQCVAAPFEMRDRDIDPETRPGRGRDCEEIDAEILGDRRAFLVAPREIGIEQQLGMFRQRLVHDSLALLDSGCFLLHT